MELRSRAAAVLLTAMLSQSVASAQVTDDATTAPAEPATPAESVATPAELAPPNANVQIKTSSAQEFLSTIALKFGTSVKRLQSLLAKLPPKGKGLNPIEINVIAGKLNLSKEDKAIFKSKVGAGGTGFNAQDIAAMSAQLGLSLDETTRLSQELGLPVPALATPVSRPAPIGSTGTSL